MPQRWPQLLTRGRRSASAAPFQLGSVYLMWTGNAAASLKMQDLQFAIANSATHQFSLATILPDVTLNFTPVPEPATIVLLATAGIAGLIMRRRG